MSGISALTVSFCLFLITPLSVRGQEIPTSLTCTSNAKASRDYSLRVKVWAGQKGHDLDPTRPFMSTTKDRKEKRTFYPLRDKVFSALDTKNPTVRSITLYEDGQEQAQEFQSSVVSRTDDAVFFVWKNPPNNKVWLAAIDLTHRKAIVTQVVQGITNLGGYVETLDCR